MISTKSDMELYHRVVVFQYHIIIELKQLCFLIVAYVGCFNIVVAKVNING